MNTVIFETKDLRVRIQDGLVCVDQRKLNGEAWREIEQNQLPVTEQWLVSPVRSSPLKIALWAFELENPGDMALRKALRA